MRDKNETYARQTSEEKLACKPAAQLPRYEFLQYGKPIPFLKRIFSYW